MHTTACPVRIPKPAVVPSGAPKVTAEDFSGHAAPCLGCGAVIPRCGHGLDPAAHTHLCCQGALVVTATWEPRGFTPEVLLSADGTVATTEWTVCPACRVPC